MVMNRTMRWISRSCCNHCSLRKCQSRSRCGASPLHQCGVDIRFVLRRPTSHIQPEPVRLPPAALRFPAIRHIAISLHTIQCMRHRNEAFTHQPIEHNNKAESSSEAFRNAIQSKSRITFLPLDFAMFLTPRCFKSLMSKTGGRQIARESPTARPWPISSDIRASRMRNLASGGGPSGFHPAKTCTPGNTWPRVWPLSVCQSCSSTSRRPPPERWPASTIQHG